MRRLTSRTWLIAMSVLWLVTVQLAVTRTTYGKSQKEKKTQNHDILANAAEKIRHGRKAFRFDTFGDQAFWGDTLKLHQAIEGSALGGVGPGVSPATALAVGLKVDIDALPGQLREDLEQGRVNLNDPAVTVALLQLNAVVGVTGVFSGDSLQSIGIQCAFCHSTVDDSSPELCFGAVDPNPGTGCIGHRLDGWPNRDLNVGAIVALAPDLSAFVNLLSVVQPDITPDDVRNVLNSWGPGKFDAELILDGKAFNPAQMTDGVTSPNPVSGATLIPPAFGLGGVNLHTWTGWGSVPHWNAFVANLEMKGKGRFWDPRLNNADQFPIAAQFGFGDLPHISPDDDLITSKLSDLQFYQLAISSPQPPDGSFDPAAAMRGDELFSGKANCNSCHVEPLWTRSRLESPHAGRNLYRRLPGGPRARSPVPHGPPRRAVRAFQGWLLS